MGEVCGKGVRKRYLGLDGGYELGAGGGGCGFGCGGRQNSLEKPVFCLLWGLRSADFDAAVEYFFNFGRFCSTFGGARAGF